MGLSARSRAARKGLASVTGQWCVYGRVILDPSGFGFSSWMQRSDHVSMKSPSTLEGCCEMSNSSSGLEVPPSAMGWHADWCKAKNMRSSGTSLVRDCSGRGEHWVYLQINVLWTKLGDFLWEAHTYQARMHCCGKLVLEHAQLGAACLMHVQFKTSLRLKTKSTGSLPAAGEGRAPGAWTQNKIPQDVRKWQTSWA